MVEAINPTTTELPTTGQFGVNYNRINSAFDSASIATNRDIGKTSDQSIDELNKQVATYGGEGSTTGAYKQAVAGQIMQRDVDIANSMMKFSIQKEQTIASREQFLQNMIAEGYVSGATGNLIRSRIDVDFQMQENQFNQQLKMAQMKADAQGRAELFQGIGTAIGMFLNPMGGAMNLINNSMNGQQIVQSNDGGDSSFSGGSFDNSGYT